MVSGYGLFRFFFVLGLHAVVAPFRQIHAVFLVLSSTGFSLASLLGRKLLEEQRLHNAVFTQRPVYTKQLLGKNNVYI